MSIGPGGGGKSTPSSPIAKQILVDNPEFGAQVLSALLDDVYIWQELVANMAQALTLITDGIPAVVGGGSLQQGPYAPAGVISQTPSGGGGTAWTSPASGGVQDGVYATCTPGVGFSEVLVATAFGFTIPSTATVRGVQFDILRFNSGAGAVQDYTILKDGSTATGRQLAAAWPAAPAWATYGGPTDNVWGYTAATVNASTMGIGLQVVDGSGGATASVDAVRCTVTYTP